VSQTVTRVNWRDEPLPAIDESLLPWGLGRSYGDSCVNDGHAVIATRGLDRIIEFDREQGILACEAGVSLAEILDLIVPAGWFLPVTPGTKFVTVGGAIANDVHGKNHERVGSFGHHVHAIEILRSDSGREVCSADRNAELFSATIGGLGLTGLILSAKLALKRIENPYIVFETIKFDDLGSFRELSGASREHYEYVVAWIDCVSGGSRLGRGLLTRGNHAGGEHTGRRYRKRVQLGVPVDFPGFALNTLSVKAFNYAYYHRQRRQRVGGVEHYDKFLYPLDAIRDWNRIYGRRGFYQYQCVVPNHDYAAIEELLEIIGASGGGSFLAVLKEFGDIPALGMLSFPREGVTLALDFANRGQPTLDLLDRLDAVVMAAGGAVYPAKDARMSRTAFAAYFPRWAEFQAYVDRRFSSSFWRRVADGSHG
jgi:FAD/FMN-containing dehydrogenase